MPPSTAGPEACRYFLVVDRTILQRTAGLGGFFRRALWRGLADKLVKREKRRRVVALQSAAGAFPVFHRLIERARPLPARIHFSERAVLPFFAVPPVRYCERCVTLSLIHISEPTR